MHILQEGIDKEMKKEIKMTYKMFLLFDQQIDSFLKHKEADSFPEGIRKAFKEIDALCEKIRIYFCDYNINSILKEIKNSPWWCCKEDFPNHEITCKNHPKNKK